MSYSYVLSEPNNTLVDNTSYVTGNQRWKYHKRPIVPLHLDDDDQFGLEGENEIDEYPPQQEADQMASVEAVSSKFRSIGVDTVYKDAYSQTDHYSPDEYIPRGTNPEILFLKEHKFGAGLPATMEEMYFIEEIREKEAFEGALPPTSDEASFSLRRKLMEDQEIKEWKKRESEIKRVQNERLNLLQSALIEREKDTEEHNATRVESIRVKKMEEKNRSVTQIERRQIKILRKIIKRKKQNEESLNGHVKRDIVAEYNNHASRVYANITREGLSLDKLSSKFEVQPYSMQRYENFNDLVSQIPNKYFDTHVNIEGYLSEIEGKYTKLEATHKQELELAEKDIKNISDLDKEDANNRSDNKENDEALGRTTPVFMSFDLPHWKNIPQLSNREIEVKIEDFEREDSSSIDIKPSLTLRNLYRDIEGRQIAVTTIQRLLRGRMSQNIMFDGKEKRLALIKELLVVSDIKQLKDEEKKALLEERHRQRVKNAFLEGIQGQTIAETLEGLSKELLRFKEQKKILKDVKRAEEERRVREAEETGTRQAELMLRQREDVFYEEIIKVHQGTIDSFLTRTMGRAVEHLSSKQAIAMARLRQAKFDRQVKDTRKQETLIKDLVSGFLIPNVERGQLRRKVQLEQRRYAQSVKDSLHETLAGLNAAIREADTN